MNLITLVTLALAPGIFWLWYFYQKDKLAPEPRHLVLRTFFLGMLVSIPVVLVETPFVHSKLFLIVVIAPIVEEYAKYSVVRRTVYTHSEFNEPIDGIIYAAAAALGFASVENTLYLISAYSSSLTSRESVDTFSAVSQVFVIRALLSVPGHGLFSSMWGDALGWAKHTEAHRGKTLIRRGLLCSFVLHSLFNGLLVTVPLAAFGVLILVAGLWWVVHRRMAKALAWGPPDRGGV